MAQEIAEIVHPHLMEAALDGETRWIQMEDCSLLMRLVLRERHLISRDLTQLDSAGQVPMGRAVAFGPREGLSVMVNEEDHLRIQSVSEGFGLDAAYKSALDLDQFLEQRLPFAFTQKLGYLTGCPTNVGTGLRASVMLHLPALGLVRSELEKVFTAAQRTGLAVRGMYGEGSRAAGDFYQISNQVTLGRTEDDLIDDLRALVPVIVNFETKVRETLFKDQKAGLTDRIMKALGILRSARHLTTEAALAHLSSLRLGHALGLLPKASITLFGELGVQAQMGHLQAMIPESNPEELLPASERDSLRAKLMRGRLGSLGDPS
jgi:protein arginine kinase